MSNTETQAEALKLADEQEAALLAVMNGEMKIGKLPVEPFVKGCAELRRLHARVAELEADVSHKDAYAEQLGRELALATAQAQRAPLTQEQRIEVCTTATTDFYAGKYSSLQFAVLDHTQRAHGITQGVSNAD